jgi:hypothetical protein
LHSTGQICSTNNTCICPTGYTTCTSGCENLSNSPSNCGSCGNTCPAGESCINGVCSCPAGETYCTKTQTCENLKTENNNCGTCGASCPAAESCINGVCSCPAGETYCTKTQTCENLNTESNNCGSCGNKCPSNNPYCLNGNCVQCITSQECPFYSTGQYCSANNTCVCPAGDTLCTDGCSNLITDINNCGKCNQACSAGESCCLGGNSFGTCVDETSDPNNCGGCGKSCINNDTNDTPYCANSKCVQCLENNDCDTGEACENNVCVCVKTMCNGVCTDTNQDPLNCGTCGTKCTTGSQTCTEGVCTCVQPASGTSKLTNCNGVCTDTSQDLLNCGTCGTKCSDKMYGSNCVNSKCQMTCPSGSVLCQPGNVCVTTSASNCGNPNLNVNPSLQACPNPVLLSLSFTGNDGSIPVISPSYNYNIQCYNVKVTSSLTSISLTMTSGYAAAYPFTISFPGSTSTYTAQSKAVASSPGVYNVVLPSQPYNISSLINKDIPIKIIAGAYTYYFTFSTN